MMVTWTGVIMTGEVFSVSNNGASDKPRWLRHCRCAKLGEVYGDSAWVSELVLTRFDE